ncbi:hypothetical protein BDQ17DRAFT_1429518 [Cyathus striatus]|nr:hypothetical protein BDQ17DRAFT_1429518 [Cyathus striatus]
MENNQAKKKITSADKNPAPTSDILPHERIVSFESPPIQSDSHPSEISCILNTEPVPFTHQLISEKALLCTRVPKVSQDGYGTTECFLYGNTAWTLFIKPGFGCAPKVPKQIFKPYQIRSDGSVGGLGMFAKRDIEFGECILVERPLMVAPLVVDLHGIECPKDIRDAAHIDPECAPRRLLEPMVRLMLDRMSLDNRKAYLDLDNAQSNSVHKLCSIWGTNSFHFPELDKLVSGDDSNVIYTMVFKEMSRLLTELRTHVQPKSFTVRLSASRNIAKGEEIFYSYIEPIIDYPIAADRQKQLKLIGFTCSCASVVHCTSTFNQIKFPVWI